MSDLIAWQQLRLDPENPRLPEGLQGASVEELLRHYLVHESAEELVGSMMESGFFTHEPLLVLPSEDDLFVVLEGNRRLAAIMLLHGVPEAQEIGFESGASPEQRENLAEIPCVRVEGREEVRALIGYRHIGGLKKWKPEAKARFIVDLVEAAADRGSHNPFLEVAREVGSNSQGIRNSYLAMKTLLWAREEHGVDVAFVQYDRFGVWQRALNSGDVRRYIGLAESRSRDEVVAAIEGLDVGSLRDVLGDLTPRDGGRAILSDSRQVTLYGRVLANERAREALRRYESLSVAAQIIRVESLPERIRDLAKLTEVLLKEVNDAEHTEELERAATELFGMARTLKASVDGLKEGADG